MKPKNKYCEGSTRTFWLWLRWKRYVSDTKMSHEENKEHLDWHKCAFTCKSLYMIENQNEMIYWCDKELNIIDECNLLRDIINPLKHAKN